MLELNTHLPGLLGVLAGPALRVWLVVTGLLVAGHYHAMAAATGRAPFFIKFMLLPLLTASGVGMVWAGGMGQLAMGALFAIGAAGLMVGVNLAVWASGAYVSAQFERAAAMKDQIAREGNVFVSGLRSMADAANLPDSSPAPLVDLPRPERATHRSTAP